MAFRLGDYVERGEVDNSVKGKVTGKLWIAGDEITLDLKGHTHPDIAGCVLKFKNPYVKEMPEDYLHLFNAAQEGLTGDISAAQKRKIPDCFPEMPESYKNLKYHWDNILYLEWHSFSNGRCVIEGVKYDWEIDLPRWKMSQEEIREQEKQSAEAMENFMDLMLEHAEKQLSPEMQDEFAWEALLKESDAAVERDIKEMEDAMANGTLDKLRKEREEKMKELMKENFSESEGDEWKNEGDEEHDYEDDYDFLGTYHLDHDLQIIVDGILLSTGKLQKLFINAMEPQSLPEELIEQGFILTVKIHSSASMLQEGITDDELHIAYFKREVDRINKMLPLVEEDSLSKQLLNIRAQLLELSKRLRGDGPY